MGLGITSYSTEDNKIEDLVEFFLGNKKEYEDFLSVLGKLAVTIEFEKKEKKGE
jgi:hypothetical protein